MDYWWDYFYSKKDVESGWGSGPCYEPLSNPVDRKAHGGIPFIEYYLQQFAAASADLGVRLLDYVDLHTYFAASTYQRQRRGFATAGDTGGQQARLNSTRVFWDPTYTDPNFPQPNYTTDTNYTTSCTLPAQAPQLIPMMKSWVARLPRHQDWPSTNITGADWKPSTARWRRPTFWASLGARASIWALCGRRAGSVKQVPGMMAFAIYRNYDGNKSTFGDTALASTSTLVECRCEGQLGGLWGAAHLRQRRHSDGDQQDYGALTSTIELKNFTAASGTTAQVYQYTSSNLNAINQLTAVSVTPPAGGGTTSTISNYSFPAQSITLFVAPQ